MRFRRRIWFLRRLLHGALSFTCTYSRKPYSRNSGLDATNSHMTAFTSTLEMISLKRAQFQLHFACILTLSPVPSTNNTFISRGSVVTDPRSPKSLLLQYRRQYGRRRHEPSGHTNTSIAAAVPVVMDPEQARLALCDRRVPTRRPRR
jgi:hypothetical protein